MYVFCAIYWYSSNVEDFWDYFFYKLVEHFLFGFSVVREEVKRLCRISEGRSCSRISWLRCLCRRISICYYMCNVNLFLLNLNTHYHFQFLGQWVRIFFEEKWKKKEYILSNNSSLFPNFHKFSRFSTIS